MKTSTMDMDTLGTAAFKTSGTAGVLTPLLSFLTNDMTLALFGLAFTVLTFVIGWYYKSKANARAEAIARQKAQEHELRMGLLRKQSGHLLFDPVSDIQPEVEVE